MSFRRLRLRGAMAGTMLLALTGPVLGDTYPRQPGIKISNYTFDITVSDANNEFMVQESAAVQFSAAGVARLARSRHAHRRWCHPRSK